MPLTHIVADDREPDAIVIETLRKLDNTQVTIRRLALGDYALDGRLLFERKTLSDLAASIKDGRFFEQGCRLAAAPLYKAMILEGTCRDLPAGAMRREAIQGAIIQMTLFLGIPVLRSISPEETARLMVYAARQFAAIRHHHGPRLYRGKRPQGKYKTQLQILQALPGVGPESARRLLDAFGSVQAVCCATPEALSQVQGFGRVKAQAIRWAVDEGATTG
ncbi:MAG: nuclease [Methylococcaceae bacterium]|nr:MAG: nuclease [Methylococcaceae bacterium]